MFEKVFQGLVVFLFFSGIGFLIYKIGKEPKERDKRKFQNYTCGEPFPEVRIGSENFYQTLKESLGLKRLRDIHSGDVTEYLIWVFLGLVAILLLIRWM